MLDDAAAAERLVRFREERGVPAGLTQLVAEIRSELGEDVGPVMLAQRLLQDRPDMVGMVLVVGMRTIIEAVGPPRTN